MKGKLQKGITLIALIITIVVLLILAVVTIGAVQESDIITKAGHAADEYNKAKNDEESALLGYESFIESNLPEGEVSGGDSNGSDNIEDGDEEDDNDTDSTRVPFTNYIEDGPYYYVYREDDTTVDVVTISRESASFTRYKIRSGQIVEQDDIYNFEIRDKLEVLNSFGIGPEDTQQAVGVAYNEINDDVIYYVRDDNFTGANIFKSNYTEMIFENHWFTLDTSYTFPSENN